MKEKLRDYALLMRLDKPIGIYLLLWPTLWALWLAAPGIPPLKILMVFVLGTVLMRSAGCAINDFADKDFDPHVARTRHRPVAAGRVTSGEALRLFVVVSLIAFGLLTSLHNMQTMLLAIPAALLAAMYPFMKRWISMPQAVLGLAFSWGIPMAYAVLRQTVPWIEVLLLMSANVMWVIAYDTFYAMADREDDLKIGVKSSAIFFGQYDRWITALLQIGALLCLALAGRQLAWPYFVGLSIAALCALYQQWLIRAREPALCFKAFLHNTWFGLAVFTGLFVATF